MASRTHTVSLGAVLVLLGLLSGTPAHEPSPAVETPATLEDMKPQDRFTYILARDREYLAYIEALDLSRDKKNRLWEHLTRKYEAYAQLDAWAEEELGNSYASEVDVLVITYDRDSEYQTRREEIRRNADAELRTILDSREIDRQQRHEAVMQMERQRRRLRHDIENMELGLTPVQFDVAMEVMENKPAFFQEPAVEGGAAGFSTAYIQERERWRFEQEQDYLESKLIPLLNEKQLKRFRTWQEGQRIELNRSLDMYRISQAFMARLYPEGKRRVQMLSPAVSGSSEKEVVYLECRQDQIFQIPVEEVRGRASKILKEIAVQSERNSRSLMQELATARVETDAYRADLTYALLGQLALRARADARGHDLTDLREEGIRGWYADLLAGLAPDRHKIVFVVRDNSMEVFERARLLAEARGIEVQHQLLDPFAIIKFNLAGTAAIIPSRAETNNVTEVMRNGKNAYYVEVLSNRVVVFPHGDIVDAHRLEDTDTPLAELMDQVAENTNRQYVVMLVHPRSAKLAAKLQAVLAARGIEVGRELYENDAPTP
jgi:hypothetical protein